MVSSEAPALAGLMQQWPLTVDRLIDHAARWHGSREVVSRHNDGSIERTDYAALRTLARRLSAALLAGGIRPGDRVATLAMNGAGHLAAWYAIMGIGAVCHTLNPRLFDAQLRYIIDHAQDRWLFADPAFAAHLGRLLPQCPSVQRVVWLGADPGFDPPLPVPSQTLESLVAAHGPECTWGDFPETTAAGLCYTSGTTGDPKGVLYSHRSNVLHTLMSIQPDVFGLGARDVVLPIVPMFHANAWGIAFSAPAVGAKLVLPGARLDGASLHELLEREGVTVSAGVPTVWQAVLQHLVSTGSRLTTLKRIVVGGAACPPVLIQRFRDEFGIDVLHAWGMTELSPLGGLSAPVPAGDSLDADARFALRSKQGRVPFGVDMALCDDAGAPVPHDGHTFGHIRVRGFAVLEHYFRAEGVPVLDAEGYFDTGDIGTIDAYGYLQITDRAKDLIKSGGEWISSIDIESAASAHPKVFLAAVIGVPHAKWGERPLLLVQLRPGERADAEDILGALRGRVATWWVPDEVRFVDGLPLGATGKIDKKALRAQFGQA